VTAANPRLTGPVPPGPAAGPRTVLAHPAVRGRLALYAVIGVNLLIVETMFVTSVTARNTFEILAKFLGLHLALLMIFQLVLVARVPWLERRIGMDRLTAWHRWTGLALFWVLLAHPTFAILAFARLDHLPFLREATKLTGAVGTLVGLLAAAVVLVAVALSVRFVRRRLSYELWHAVHAGIYLAVVLVLVHQSIEGSTFRSSPVTTVYWWALWAGAITALLVGRVAVPVWRNARYRLRVAAVVPESDSVVSVYVTGRGLDRLPARAGQFFIWRFPGHHSWWRANPFSLSAAPDGRSLRLTAKAAGTTSAGLRRVPVGTRVFAEGPYGAFTALHRSREATLLIAGGVGVTPVRALLEELSGPAVVLYRVRTMADAVLLPELDAVARLRGARLHVLAGRTGAGSPPYDPLGPAGLAALVPDVRDRDVYVCGPPAMTTAVLRSLRTLGVPRVQVHAERFALAGG